MNVYCKYCGKQITDDALFCQYCGEKQDVDTFSIRKKDNKKELSSDLRDVILVLFSERKKKYLILYAIWGVIHIICWMYGESPSNSFNPQWRFYPFTSRSISDHYFNIDYYDGTEFLVYVFLVPLIAYFYFQYWHESLMIKIKEWKKKNRQR